MNSQPLVSVIIPLYNRSQLVAETLDSVLHQTYSNWECLVIDDGSTDNSIEVVTAYAAKDRRITLLQRTSLPKGANHCRNIGLEKANGKYIMFLDSDDLLHNNCLESRISKYNENVGLDFIVFNTLLFLDNNNLYDYNILWNIDGSENDLYRFLRTDGVWPNPGPLYTRSFIDRFPFDEELPFWQDLELAIRILKSNPRYKKFLDEEPDVFIRWHRENSISRSKKRIKQELKIINGIGDQFAEDTIRKSKKFKTQFLTVYYELSKKGLLAEKSLASSFLALINMLKLFPQGFFLFITLCPVYLFMYLLIQGNSTILSKIRGGVMKMTELFVDKMFSLPSSQIFSVRYEQK